jgi:hypothetical protein
VSLCSDEYANGYCNEYANGDEHGNAWRNAHPDTDDNTRRSEPDADRNVSRDTYDEPNTDGVRRWNSRRS